MKQVSKEEMRRIRKLTSEAWPCRRSARPDMPRLWQQRNGRPPCVPDPLRWELWPLQPYGHLFGALSQLPEQGEQPVLPKARRGLRHDVGTDVQPTHPSVYHDLHR